MTENKGKRLLQIQETKESFQTALLILLEDKKIDQIKINELSQKAGYARRTFYRYYESPYHILQEIIDKETVTLFKELKVENHTNFKDFVVFVFAFWKNRLSLLIALEKNDLFQCLIQSWFCYIRESNLIQKRHFNNYYQQQFSIGGISQMLHAWVIKGCRETPEEMGIIAQSILKELRREA